ncbi:MAG: hypothetical protein K8R13_03175 [Methanococcoides sp.]|nr:hypothetical protein [Methanococcoides sp.]
MDKDFRLTRHTALWEEQNKRIKRTIIAGLVFGLLLLVNVLKPYSSDIDKKRDIRTEIEIYKKEKGVIENSITAIDDFKETLGAVQITIREQPWMKEKDKLIRTLAGINERGEGNRQRYQEEADNTVRVIGAQVNEMVVKPLNEFLPNYPRVAVLMPELYTELKTLPMTIQEWIRRYLGKRWYSTLESKMERVESLSRGLEVKLDTINNKISMEKPNLVRKRKELTQEITRMENKADIQAKKKLLKTLEARMDKIMPEWIRGLISLHQMIQYYPLIILGLVIYVLALAISLNSHYDSMAAVRKINQAAKTDPIFSSLWTLTYRGHVSTILTIASYVGFVAAMWILFEMGSDIFAKWLIEKGEGFLGNDSLKIIRWIGRCILAATVCFVAIKPYYHKSSTSSVTEI